jgi:Protein of unknown function (DUF4065)
MTSAAQSRLTYKVHLAGGQARLREMIIYVSSKCVHAPRWGKTKLNKILWRADFTSFAERGVPVTGRPYQRLRNGPAPTEMAPLLGEMLNNRVITIDFNELGHNVVEERIFPIMNPNLQAFSRDDIKYIDDSINYYWDDTATEASDDSHGIAWKSRADGDPMPYELSYLSDRQMSLDIQRKLAGLGAEHGWKSE